MSVPNKRLAVFATHPIQYQVPIWRALAATPGLEIAVHYFNDHCIRGELNAEFGVEVAWDVPLLEGYEYRFLQRNANLQKKLGVKMPNARSLLEKEGFDSILIQGYIYQFERDVVLAAKALHIKTILRAELTDVALPRGVIKSVLRNAYLRWFYRHIDVFCSVGQEAQKHLERHNIADNRIFFSPYCVDSDFFQSQKEKFNRVDSRKTLGISNNEIALLYCGKLIPRKAPLLLVKALANVNQENLSLIVVGDGPLREFFEKEARAVLGQRLHMAGFVNQSKLGQYYRAADVFVLPSKYETWGLVVNEAMQFGLPVIVSDKVGCHPDLLLEGKTGYVFTSGDADSLVERISKILQDKDSFAQMGKIAEEHIKKYSTQASVKGILQSIGVE